MDSVAEELRRVAAGLRLVFFGLVALGVSGIASVVVAATLAEPSADAAAILISLNRDHPTVVALLIGLGVLASVLGIAGKAYCLSVPSAAQATRLIVPALVCSGLSLAFSIAGNAGEVAELGQMSPVFAVVGYLFFVRFLRRLAVFLGTARLAIRAQRVQAGTMVLFVLLLIANLGNLAGGGGALAIVLVGLTFVIGGISLFGMYSLLVHDMRRTTEGAADYVAERGDD